MTTAKIGLAGEGWGAIAALKGLQKAFERIDVLSSDPEVLEQLRQADSIVENFDESEAGCFICAGYKKIIGPELLEKRKFVNIHYSLLPRYRGMHSTVWAILNDEKDLGMSIHEMNEKIDDGDILYQWQIQNDFESSATWYMHKFNDMVEEVAGAVIKKYLNGSLVPKEQDRSQATFVKRRNLDDCQLDFNRDHNYLKAFFRALQPPYPYPFILVDGERIFVKDYELSGDTPDTSVGAILSADIREIRVRTSQGTITLKDLMGEGSEWDPSRIRETEILKK